MATHMEQGVILPRRQAKTPARVVNLQSKKNHSTQRTIRLDKLLRKQNPVILIKRRLGGIGDVLMSTPLLKAIKKLIPGCHLVYATDLKYAQGALKEVIEHCPYVDELIAFADHERIEADYAVDITTTGLPRERAGEIPPNRIDMFAEEVGISVEDDPVPVYLPTKQEEIHSKVLIKQFLGGRNRDDVKIIAIQVRSNDARRTWPLEYVDQLADILAANEDFHVILMDWGGNTKRWQERERVYTAMNLDIADTAGVLQQSDVVVCPDSSMLHLAGALSKKTVAIFGPIPPESRINHYPNATAVVRKMRCSYCWYSPRCSAFGGSHLECLNKLEPKTVYDAILAKLSEPIKVERIVKYGGDMTVSNQDPIVLVERRTAGIGDLLMAGPGIEALRYTYPGKEIHVAAPKEPLSILYNNPYISKFITIPSAVNYKRYHAVIDISSPCARYESIRVSQGKNVEKSRVEIFSEALGTRSVLETLTPKYYMSEEEVDWANNFAKHNIKDSTKKTIGLAFKSNEAYRDWPLSYYDDLINKLYEKYNILLLGSNRDYFSPNVIDGCGFELRKSAAILSKCDGLVTVDTAQLHIAAAMDIPTIALFGPIDYKARCKGYKNLTALVTNMECIPCWRNGNTPCKISKKIKGYSECLLAIKPNKLVKIIKQKF